MFCLDTDVLSFLISPSPPLGLLRRFVDVPPEEQCTTSITLGEMLYGAARLGSPTLAKRIDDSVRRELPIISFDEPAAQAYGLLRASLESRGQPLAEADLRIASICLSNDLTLITGNVRHFARVPGLRVENWLAE